jgi:hypothetical protein
MAPKVNINKTLPEVKRLLNILRDSMNCRQSKNENKRSIGYKELVKISVLLTAQNHSEDIIKDIGFLLGSLHRKPANVVVFETCGVFLDRGRTPIQHGIYHIYGTQLDIDLFEDKNLLPNYAVDKMVDKPDVKEDVPSKVENSFAPSALLGMAVIRNNIMYDQELNGGDYNAVFKYEDHGTSFDETAILQEPKMYGHTQIMTGFNTQDSISTIFDTASQNTDQQILKSVLSTHYSVAIAIPFHQTKALTHVICEYNFIFPYD